VIFFLTVKWDNDDLTTDSNLHSSANDGTLRPSTERCEARRCGASPKTPPPPLWYLPLRDGRQRCTSLIPPARLCSRRLRVSFFLLKRAGVHGRNRRLFVSYRKTSVTPAGRLGEITPPSDPTEAESLRCERTDTAKQTLAHDAVRRVATPPELLEASRSF